MNVIKRDGRVAVFDKNKIVEAITKAYLEVDREITHEAKRKAEEIADYVEALGAELSVEDIQDLVENKLMSTKRKDVARSYILYRNKRTVEREKNSELIKTVSEKLTASNVENQNANVDEKSFGGRMGEANDALMKQYALNYCMSDMARRNHLNNEIYTHDLNSYAVGMHNCYDSSTRFVTKSGVKNFGSCTDGQKLEVVDKNGEWREATVHRYGKQKMYNLKFESGLTTKTVTCTRNHRWVLNDGTVTENIQIGDSLLLTPEIKNDYIKNEGLWCFGFVLGDGCDFAMKSKDGTRVTNNSMTVRLCDDKNKYLDKFLRAGWSIRQKHENGDNTVLFRGNGSFKQPFLDNKMWKLMSHDDLCNIFEGYMCADGHFYSHGSVAISTADIRLKEFIEDVSSVLGYYVWSKKIKTGDTNYKKDRTLYEFHLTKAQATKWTLKDITTNDGGQNGCKVAWCVEEPVTHTFTLDGGMVTGNCLSIPFDKLLAKGFNTRQTDVRPANSVNTAFQLVAVIFQLQSLQQFGRVYAAC